jgi:4-diphosphocytidyl-2-C-methyl-D-erythritol kinase
MLLHEHAPAKVNLWLHVLERRLDGYHTLDSLVVFTHFGDTVTCTADLPLGLTVSGLDADALMGDDNFILKAVRAVLRVEPSARVGHFHLEKRLPRASGLGGGTSDGAAALRLLARLNQWPSSHPALQAGIAALGADGTVCFHARACRMQGIGENVTFVDTPSYAMVLINPRIPLETRDVFKGVTPSMASPVASDDLFELQQYQNDLEKSAIALCPLINELHLALRARDGCFLTRMSGSGATVFGLFAAASRAQSAAEHLKKLTPWWVCATSSTGIV